MRQKLPPKPSKALPALPEGGGQRAGPLTINSAEAEKYLQLLPLLKKAQAEFFSTENMKEWVRLLLHKHGFQTMSLYSYFLLT